MFKTLKPNITESKNGIWKYAWCPRCIIKLNWIESHELECSNCGYRIDMVKVRW